MRFAKLTVAAVAACSAVISGSAFTAPSSGQRTPAAIAANKPNAVSPFSPRGIRTNVRLSMSAAASTDVDAAIDAAIEEAGSGVALFGKSGCPFCKKTKKALFAAGIHPVVVELDQVENGPAIQKSLEGKTGKATVPNVWLDGKFLGGSEEVLAGLEDGTFDGVERKEVIEMEDEPKIPVEQGPDCIKVGDALPTDKMWTAFGDPEAKVDLLEYTKSKSIVIVGLPGAFTPTWSSQQVPSYVEYTDKLKEVGIDGVIIYCVNDPAVMMAWAKDQGIEGWELGDEEGYVSFLSDATGDFTKACGIEMTDPGPLGVGIIGRCKRFAMYVKDGTVKAINVSEYEGDPAGDGYPEMSLPAAMIEAIKKA